MKIILCIILAFILSGIVAFILEKMSDNTIDTYPLAILTVIIFGLGFVAGGEPNANITTSSITTYTYQCQICEETTTQTEEPKIMICDDCKEIIKNIESEDKE